MAPLLELSGEIGRRLARERRVGWSDPLPAKAMAFGAGRQAPSGVANRVEWKASRSAGRLSREGQGRIVAGNEASLRRRQAPGDPVHLRVMAAAVGKGVELAKEIARIKAGKARRSCAVALPVHSMAGEAGVAGAGASPAQRDKLAAGDEALGR